MMNEIKICPFRTYTTQSVVMDGQSCVTVTEFMECLKSKCPAWHMDYEEIPASTKGIWVEHCRRLE